MYFQEFEKIPYRLNRTTKVAVNIFNSLIVQYKPAYDATLLYYYSVKDGQKPEHIAEEYYGSVKYTWIIILMNNIVDPFFDWPLSSHEFSSYVRGKYPNPNAIYAFVDNRTDRHVDDVDHAKYQGFMNNNTMLPHYITPVTFYQMEFDKNMKKMDIKLLNKRFLKQFTEQFLTIMER